MIKVNSLDSVQNHHIGNESYKMPITPDSDYVVDDSNFIPMSEAVKQLGTAQQSGDSLKSHYDFADGVDTGIEIPITRTKNGKDIAEISTDIMNKVSAINDKVEKAKAFEKFKAETEANMKSMKVDSQKPSE